MKAPQPVSLEGLPASRRVLVWLMLAYANGQGRPGACEEPSRGGPPRVGRRRLSVPGVCVCRSARVRMASYKILQWGVAWVQACVWTTISASWSCGCQRGVSTGPAPGAGRGAAARRCRGVWGAGPLRRGEFERGIPLSCCRPGQALFIPYNSVLYKKERPHRLGTNPGGRSGANRLGFSRFAFCIRSSYTVGAPAAISRRNAPRVIKSARAGNAVAVRRRRCAECVDALRPAVRPGRFWRAFRFGELRSAGEDAGRRRPGGRSEHLHKTGTEPGHTAGASAGAIRGVHSRPYPVLRGIKDRLIPAACSQHPSSFGQSFPNVNGT